MNNDVVIYQSNDGLVKMEAIVDASNETIWATQKAMGLLLDVDRSVITKHLSNIFKEGELDKDVVCAKFAQTTQHGAMEGEFQTRDVNFYNLDAIISVGYRVKSKRGVLFRQWASNIIQDYLIKGYAINEERSLVTNENYVRLINKVESLDERVSNIENNYKPKKFKNSQLFFDGHFMMHIL